MEIVTQLLQDYITNKEFLIVMGITFVLFDSLQEIKWIDEWAAQYKKLAAVVIGSGLGLLIIEMSAQGAIAGFFAGASLTMGMERLKILTRESGSVTPSKEDRES